MLTWHWARLYLKAPRILGGDVSKAIEYLEKGLKFGPNNALMRLRLAEAYAEANRNDDAQKRTRNALFESTTFAWIRTGAQRCC